MDLDRDAVAQADAVGCFILDDSPQHRRRVQQASNEALYNTRLPPIARDDHDGRQFARAEESTPVAERGQENRDRGQDKRLTGAASAHQPCFLRPRCRRRAAPGVPPVNL